MDRESFAAWIELYERAWRTPGTEVLAQLFAPEAEYVTAPFREPHRGLEAIAELWDAERAGPDERFTMTYEILAVEGDTGVARLEVVYEDPPKHYLDVWIARFDGDGRCTWFEEWFWEKPKR